jgi:Putative auto-transporter adhesin, head GIN domain
MLFDAVMNRTTFHILNIFYVVIRLAYSLLVLMILGSVLSSCNKENAPDCFQSAGSFKTVKRNLEAFDMIELRDYIQIELYDTTEYFVEITAPQNLIPEIETNIHNGKLKIENKNTCNFVRSYKNRITVRIYAPQFNDIQNYCTGDIKCINTISSSIFKLENRNAAGTIQLDVDVDSIWIATHTGVSDVVAKGESTITNIFNNSSINDVYVNTHGYFFALIEFSGNIFYTGVPNHIDSDIKGNGRLVHIE